MDYNEKTPKQIVEELNKYIIGQENAKKSVAIALRNRYRSKMLPEDWKDEIVPKNILMIGSTGVGKTEIARRLAKLVKAPFVKVEATKFTEVGYVGRDVESMVRELLDAAIRMVKKEKLEEVQEKAKDLARKRILDHLVPMPTSKIKKASANIMDLFNLNQNDDSKESIEDLNTQNEEAQEENKEETNAARKWAMKRLDEGKMEDKIIEINIPHRAPKVVGMFSNAGMDEINSNIQDLMNNIVPKKKKSRKVTVKEAREIFIEEEAQKLLDQDQVIKEAMTLTERYGIIFLDEIDKVAVKNGSSGSPGISREGVQRDILPIVEGSTINSKYGPIKTDHILFIAAGAFHMSKPSDLIPELQGRFPIRVELTSLTKDDFKKILTEPRTAILKQYEVLLETEDINLSFTDCAIDKLSEIAYQVNEQSENIGARRLHTIMEHLLEDISFNAPDLENKNIVIDEKFVTDKMSGVVKDPNLSQFIL